VDGEGHYARECPTRSKSLRTQESPGKGNSRGRATRSPFQAMRHQFGNRMHVAILIVRETSKRRERGELPLSLCKHKRCRKALGKDCE
jgi:hypothetical protein